SLGQPQVLGNAVALTVVQALGARRFDINRGPCRMQFVSGSLGVADQTACPRYFADADEQSLVGHRRVRRRFALTHGVILAESASERIGSRSRQASAARRIERVADLRSLEVASINLRFRRPSSERARGARVA